MLRFAEVPTPVPGPDEVLSEATRPPSIPRTGGCGVSKFKPGDAVFALPGVRMGCHAEYRCMAQDAALALKPANVSHAQAAALSFGGTTALHSFAKRASAPARACW